MSNVSQSVIANDDPLDALNEATKQTLANQQLEAFGQRLYLDRAELEILEALSPEDRQLGRPPNPGVQGDTGELSDEEQIAFLQKRIRRYTLAMKVWQGRRDLVKVLADVASEDSA